MYATNVRNLKKNPSLALRQAKLAPVLILKGNQPDAILLHLDKSLTDTEQSLRPALAASLYKDQVLSLGAAAKLSGLTLVDFIGHLEALEIDIVKVDKMLGSEAKNIETWLKT